MKKRFPKLLAIVMLLLFFSANTFAIPANSKPQTIKQPNGKSLTFTLKGDESVNWASTIDKYTLINNSEGNFVYAQLNEDGDLVPSNYLASNPDERSEEERVFLSTLPFNLFFSQKQIDERKNNLKLSSTSSEKFPTVGQIRMLVILVNFSDKTFSFSQSNFNNMCNQIGYSYNGGTGSAAEYFKANSGGLSNMVFDVVGPVTLPQSSSYYASNGMYNMSSFTNSAITLADPNVDYSLYDNDGDGRVDNVHFIFAGTPQSSTGNTSEIWPHASSFYNVGSKDGVGFRKYSCSAEKRNLTSMDGIGTLCHETSHILGLPDFYDTDYSNSGGEGVHLETWDIMASGGYNNSSNTPPLYHSYERQLVNWGTPIILTNPTNVILPALSDSLISYKIELNSSEFLILENRHKKGWDTYVPSEGLLIMQGDYDRLNRWPSGNDINVIPSDMGLFIRTATGSTSDNTTANAVFPGNVQKTYFTNKGNPKMTLKDGTVMNKPITHISFINDSTISFRYFSQTPQVVNKGVDASTIKGTTALVKGEIVYPSPNVITERGFYYHTNQDSVNTTNGNKVISSNTDSLTNVTLIGLTPSTLYYFRPFASTSFGTELGSVMNFTTTDGMGIVTTGNTNNINNNDAQLSGTLIDLGEGTFIEKGFVITTNSVNLPTINDTKITSNGSTIGAFTATATNLTEQTTYYYRAFVTNNFGTKYGVKKSFTTTYPLILNDSIFGNQSFCEQGSPTLISGQSPTGGRGNFTYIWEEKKLNTPWTLASQTHNQQNYQPQTLSDSTFYRRIVISDGTLRDTSNVVLINIKRTWGGNIVSSKDTIVLGTGTGTMRLMNSRGTILNWERIKGNDTLQIQSTSVTYSEVPSDTGLYAYRAKVQYETCPAKYSEFRLIRVNDSSSSLSDINFDINLKLYPNPNKGVFTITSSFNDIVDLKIINSLGQIVLSQKALISNKEINLQDAENGTYIISITANGKQTTKTFIINK